MTETVSEFKARVARLRKKHPGWREWRAVFAAMRLSGYGASGTQGAFAEKHSKMPLDHHFHDSRIPAFIAAAVEAGVLREG